MSVAKTGIEWTDSTWNPVTGCTKVSAGCDHCYAETMARTKLREVYGKRLPIVDTPENREDPFAVRLWPERMSQPAKWPNPRRIFVNSMSDLFHVDVPDEYVREIFEVMLEVDRHTYQVLTKRPSRARRFVEKNADMFPTGRVPGHIWMGTSVENGDAAYRIGHLLSVPAAVRFLSMEPLLGPVDLQPWFHAMGETLSLRPIKVAPRLHWIITGGESGIGYRPCNPEWVRSIRDQCNAAGVAFLHKQWGGRTPKAGGRDLDGRTWDEYPEV
jgi:protein gp37